MTRSVRRSVGRPVIISDVCPLLLSVLATFSSLHALSDGIEAGSDPTAKPAHA